MKIQKSYSRSTVQLFVSVAMVLGCAFAPGMASAAGPAGFAIGLGSAVNRVLERGNVATPFAGVSDPVSLSRADNINTRGYALRRDGAY